MQMISRASLRGVAATAGLILVFAFLVLGEGEVQSQQPGKAGLSTKQEGQSLDVGRQIFESRCASCHGLDGRGTERGPDLAADAKVQRRTDAGLLRTIRNGIAGTGMPAFRALDDAAAKSVADYVRLLQGKTKRAAVPGNAQRGQTLFFGKARCSECHMVSGKGGFIASDLSTFGRTQAVEEIRRAILLPAEGNKRGGVFEIRTRDGQSYSGVVRNEDNFSVQLQTLDGGLHLFMKSEVESMMRRSDSLMPADYASTLSAGEIDDLVSFLIRVSGPARKKAQEEEFEE